MVATWRTAGLEGRVIVLLAPGKERVGSTGQKGHSPALHVDYLIPSGPVQLQFVDPCHPGCGN